MDTETTFPQRLLPEGYLSHFNISEYKFRWHEASGLDPDLHFRANHLASRLTSLWITDAHTLTAKHQLARITNTSIRTMDRALTELEDRGWVHVSRDGDGLSIYLVIPRHGLERLLAERQSSEQQRNLRTSRELAAQEVLLSLATAYGTDHDAVRTGADWKVVRARIRSITNRMTDIEQETRKLIHSLCESIPQQIRCPQALVSSRIDEHLRNYTHLSHRPSKRTRVSSDSESSVQFENLIHDLAAKLCVRPNTIAPTNTAEAPW